MSTQKHQEKLPPKSPSDPREKRFSNLDVIPDSFPKTCIALSWVASRAAIVATDRTTTSLG
eukprot:6276929-Amphidinium_carterae.1